RRVPTRAGHKKRRPLRGASQVTGEDRMKAGKGAALAVVVPIVLVGVAITLSVATAFAHEAIELFAILGLAQIGHIFLEGVDLGIETGALFLEALELVGTIVIEGGIAGRGEILPAEAAMAGVVSHEAASFVPIGLGLFGGAAELLTPQDVAKNGQADGPEEDKAEDHEGDG